ncbi:DUF3068 domain-containing protein [Corynebacterium jeikeium]|jgi:hypothetical protein|uniref:DUF3068 domain-containing protein n=1 Tax=Corynebacterium jeikeium TaxID=38289 RepID=UPI0001B717F6|nr:DUF3068 domain-containing protein [Corynebacterium jeikeium]EEW16555.1 hypothetical protein HMPREF0297_1062 [Corynebacterium jeikeium ATCC 43734]OOD29860.1 hypothetical protein BWP03_08635 [Corynebacterium jeikeium]WCZ52712.1 hypothetical protein CJEIK_00835 [Corynebacterium jeikeium]SUY81982.1 putative integral membrane protein [Corynebacterium jeikeium]
MKRILSSVAIVLGVAMLVFAIALPTYVVPKGKVLPLDLVSTTGTPKTPGNLLDSGALAAGKPVGNNKDKPECKGDNPQVSCFINKDLEMQSQRFTTAQEPSDKEVVTLEAGQTLFRTDKEEPKNLISASIDHVTLDRKTQMPVPDPTSSIELNAPALDAAANEGKDEEVEASVAPFTRPGITYQFPMGTDRKSYDYFDMQILKTQPIDYVGEEEQDGEKVYRFEQTVPPTELYPALRERLEADGELSKGDKGTLAALRLKFPAKVWGIDPADIKKKDGAQDEKKDEKAEEKKEGEEGKDSDKEDLGPEVELSRYYTVHRVLRVQPDTGVIVNGSEEVFQYYAQDDEEAQQILENKEEEIKNPTRTAVYFPGAWDDESREAQMKKSSEGLEKMKLMGTILPWILGVVGLILLVVGWIAHRSARLAAK